MRSANYFVSGLTYNQVIHGICCYGLQAKNQSNLPKTYIQNLFISQNLLLDLLPYQLKTQNCSHTKKSTIRSAKLKMQNSLGKRGKNQDKPKYYICYPEQTMGQIISPLSKNPGDCELYSENTSESVKYLRYHMVREAELGQVKI